MPNLIAQQLAKKYNKQCFYITINGHGKYKGVAKRVTVYYTAGRAKTYGTGKNAKPYASQHFEFWTKGPGPISETGYRSHFISGTRQQLGLTNKNIRNKIIKMAEVLAAEYKGVTV
jgi:hypothetical protein